MPSWNKMTHLFDVFSDNYVYVWMLAITIKLLPIENAQRSWRLGYFDWLKYRYLSLEEDYCYVYSFDCHIQRAIYICYKAFSTLPSRGFSYCTVTTYHSSSIFDFSFYIFIFYFLIDMFDCLGVFFFLTHRLSSQIEVVTSSKSMKNIASPFFRLTIIFEW